jgi:hypothetical protein
LDMPQRKSRGRRASASARLGDAASASAWAAVLESHAPNGQK